MTATTLTPGLVAGRWTFDVAHSEVSFTVRHLMVSKVRGTFNTFDGEIVVAENPLDSAVTATIDMSSIDTREESRDNHLRSSDFFSVEQHPQMAFRSNVVRPAGEGFVLAGELTIKGVTKPLELALEFNGVGGDPWGGTRAGFTAKTDISRKEFGVDLEMPLEGGGVVVGDKISVTLEIEAVLQQG
ncbi:MAG TPA: YceI family protein [Mycobacteriales bacterium]|jgi:polyisoprenoid-binding protein YceI|nr:YceI family protein [Mycobacteriales bacterium]